MQGGPLEHVIAAKAVCFKLAMEDSFKEYIDLLVKNSKSLADAMMKRGFRIVSGGTDNHLILVDLTNKEITGKECEKLLDTIGITTNKNTIPFETKSPFITSGVRMGTAAVTTRGFQPEDMDKIAEFIDYAVNHRNDDLSELKQKVRDLCAKYPLYKK